MLEKLQDHLSKNFQFLENKKLLLTTSGGLDSMVLLHLFQNLKYNIAIAHCNFQLRGIESFEDQNFVSEYAMKHQISIFITQFDTENFAKDYKISIQVAARELRYNWFYELLETEKFDYILTAHHADDNLETFIINLSRGTGLEGLIGIPSENNKVIRPLLAFPRQEIENFANLNNVIWREDSSNALDKYLRNKIRHHMVPILKEINPKFLEQFEQTQKFLQESHTMVEDAAIMIYQQVANEVDENIYFDLKKLKQLPNFKSYLYFWLKEFGFTAWNDIYDLVDAQSGKQVFAPEFKLLKNRNFFILQPINLVVENDEKFWVENFSTEVKFPLNLTFSQVETILNPDITTIFVDQEKLNYPLLLRKWEEADVFFPFGMDGKSKKVSKFFKDEKLSLIDKKKVWLLCSDNQIVWIIGLRQDERFRITEKTKNKIQIKFLR